MEKLFDAKSESILDITEFAAEALRKNDINPNLIYEYQLLVEEITIKLVDNAKQGAQIKVDVFKHLGGTNIKLTCPGKAIILEQEDEFDFGGKIIEEFGDYIKQSYSAGVNQITFSSSTTESNHFLVQSGIYIGLSLAVALIMNFLLPESAVQWANENIVFPLVSIFAKCLGTVATPVAFFSLAAFLVTLKLTIESDKKLLVLVIRYIATSIAALVFGVIIWDIYKKVGISFDLNMVRTQTDNFMGNTVGEFIEESVAGNLIEPFTGTSPVPMLVMGIILGIAAGSYFGPYGDVARNGLEALNGLFCKMMDVVYNVIPFFLFFALIRGWMDYGFTYYLSLLKNIVILLPGFILLAILYLVELGISGISPLRFIKDYRMILLENLKIGSNIQAMPYNKRTMSRMISLPRDILEKGLKLGSMMNMDGNCVIISMGIMGMIASTGIELSVAKWIMLAFIVILLSVGAPNQPGSFLLGMAVLMSFVGLSSNLTGDLLIIEALLGKLYSCANATGDIVTLAIENQRYEKKMRKENAK